MELRPNYYLAPISAACGSLNFGYLIAQGIKLVVVDEFVWLMAIFGCCVFWGAIAYWFWSKKEKLSEADLIIQVYVFAFPSFGNIGIIWGLLN